MTLIAMLASTKALFSCYKEGITLTVYTICFLLYLAVGGLFFILIEGPQIEKSQKDILDLKNKIMQKYPNISVDALDEYTSELKSLGIKGIPDTVKSWTYADAVFFSATLLTTIGYGHVSPRSVLGKIICILYTGFGIPVTLLLLSSYVERLIKFSESYKSSLFRKLGDVCKPFHIRLTHITSIMVIILLLCFLLPALVFSYFERGWGVLDGIYFCFISLTTVGLGDLVPALDTDMPHIELYKYGVTIFLVAGVTVMMFTMVLTADFHQHYNCDYENLPFTVTTEKIPINPSSTLAYGSIITDSGKSEEETIEKIVHPT